MPDILGHLVADGLRRLEISMLDLTFILLGIAVLALTGLYAVALQRI